jgi:hypothetical protein
MFIKILISTVIIVALIVIALGVKLWIDPDAEFSSHSCSLDSGELDDAGACSICLVKDLTDCSEKK